MNRTDRLLALILELQSRKVQRAEDLAATFETSKRTIYRDLQALMEAGVPLISQPGVGYSLVEGYFLPPLSFTQDEAAMLLLGADFMAGSFDAEYRAAAERASHKITAVLPETLRERVHAMQQSIWFIAPSPNDPTEHDRLLLIRRAILRGNTIRFTYHTKIGASGEAESNQRDADPYMLVHVEGVWHLTAWCHLRKGLRNFRLSRMETVTILDRTFTRPADFIEANRRHMDASRTVTARVWFDPQVALWLEEDTYFFIEARHMTADGLRVTLRMRHEQEIVDWLLRWGKYLRRIEPDSLRERVLNEYRTALNALEKS